MSLTRDSEELIHRHSRNFYSAFRPASQFSERKKRNPETLCLNNFSIKPAVKTSVNSQFFRRKIFFKFFFSNTRDTYDRFINILVLWIAVSNDILACLSHIKNRRKEKKRENGKRHDRHFVSSACCVIRVTFHRRANSTLTRECWPAEINGSRLISLLMKPETSTLLIGKPIQSSCRVLPQSRPVLLEIHRQSYIIIAGELTRLPCCRKR